METQISEAKVPRGKIFVAPLLILLVLIYLGFLLYQAVFVNYQTNKKISELNRELEKSKEDKADLETLIAYYQTSAFQELEARRKLGLKMPGEKVIKVEVEKTASEKAQNEQPAAKSSGKSNPEYWVDYLFYSDL